MYYFQVQVLCPVCPNRIWVCLVRPCTILHDISPRTCRIAAMSLLASDNFLCSVYTCHPFSLSSKPLYFLFRSRNYRLLNCYHNLCAVNYTSSHALCFTLATCILDWYASDNKLPGSRDKTNNGRLTTCRLWTADANSYILSRSHAVTLPWPWEFAFRKEYWWHGRGKARYVWIKHGRTVKIKWETHNLKP
jgi:hypothetical protein